MAIPASGAISLSTIQTEFGGANPIGLNEYYAGGTYVPAGTTGTYGAVPSSGQISLQNFYGTSNFLDRQTVTTGDNGGDPPDQERGFSYGSFGSIVDGTSNIYSGAIVNRLLWRASTGVYIFNVAGSQPNSGWTTLTIVGNGTAVLTRSSASFSASASTAWIWTTADNVSTQVFGSVSSTVVCTFT